MLMSLVSCNEDLLDLKNPNTLDSGSFWKTEKDADLGINAVYNMFYKQGTYSRWLNYSFDLKSDECTNASPWLELQDWTKFKYVNYDFWEGNYCIWRDHYKAIFRANQVLAYVPEIPFESELKKQRVLGEARYLRAMYYYNLALLWGSVPIVVQPSKPIDQPFSSSQDSVFSFIANDLLLAQQMLQEKYTGNDVGRATVGAAKALLARVYMMQHKWEKAKDQLYWLVEGSGNGNYGLATNWEDNFKHTTENNIESVFEIQYSDVNPGGPEGDVAGQGMGFHRAQFFAPNGIGWGEGIVRRWVVDEFLKEKRTDGQYDRRVLRTAWFNDQRTFFPFDNNLVYGKSWSTQWDFETTNTGESGHQCLIRKYQGDYYRTFETYECPINFRYIRFADVLLMYAECVNNISGPSNAVKYVDMVRNRAKLNNLSVNYPQALLTKENFQERLEIERTLELCGEQVRWADLMRWGYFDDKDKISKLKSRDADFKLFDDVTFKHKFFPLPNLELSANVNLKQNPNY